MPAFPDGAAYLWTCYLRLRHRAAPGFAGPSPVTWQDIDAFIRRSGMRLASWEIRVIERLDDVFLGRIADDDAPPKSAPVDGTPMRDGASLKALMGQFGKRRLVRRTPEWRTSRPSDLPSTRPP